MYSLGRILLAFVLLHFVLQGQICLLLQVSLDLLLLHSNPLRLREHLFLVLVLDDLIGYLQSNIMLLVKKEVKKKSNPQKPGK